MKQILKSENNGHYILNIKSILVFKDHCAPYKTVCRMTTKGCYKIILCYMLKHEQLGSLLELDSVL